MLFRSLMTEMFVFWIFLFLLIGGALLILSLFKDYDFIPLIAAAFFGLSLGLFLQNRTEWFTYVIIDPAIASNMLGDHSVLGVIIMLVIFIVISIVGACCSCFAKSKKEAK